MYSKNLNKSLNLRLSQVDYDFIEDLAEKRGTKPSEVVRNIIGEYRRSVLVLEKIRTLNEVANKFEGEIEDVNSKTY